MSQYPDIWDIIKDNLRRVIHDEEPVLIDPFITKTLITLNTAIFLFFATSLDEAITTYGLIPSLLFAGEWHRLLTSMYLHADFIGHLAANMTFLYVFGDNVEEKTTWRYILYYHLFGVAAGLGYVAQATVMPELWTVPAVGASGAISGIIGYYIVRFPDAKVVFMSKPMPAYMFGALFFLEQIALIFMITNIAWSAHLTGFLAGVIVAVADRK